MKETKLSVLRQFGSEQFSATVTFDKILTKEELKDEVTGLGHGISEAFNKVLEREESEKKILALASEKRTAANKVLEDQIKKEMDSASQTKDALSKADKLVKRSNYK